MKKKLILLTVCLLVGYSAWAKLTSPWGDQKVVFTPAEKVCETLPNFKYCTYSAVHGVNDDLIYHLHGRNLDENSWNDDTYFTAMLQNSWQRAGVKPPKVVSISFGPIWLLAKKGQAEKSGLLEEFLRAIQTVESKIGKPRSRILVGESMGGLNVLTLGFAAPAQFSKIASLCPGLYLDSPFSSMETLKKAIERTGADPKIVYGVVQMSKQFVANEQEWLAFSPLETIASVDPKPELYLSCGLYDAYGNFEGSEALASKALHLGFKTEWHPLYGGHCAIDVSSLSAFLTK